MASKDIPWSCQANFCYFLSFWAGDPKKKKKDKDDDKKDKKDGKKGKKDVSSVSFTDYLF